MGIVVSMSGYPLLRSASIARAVAGFGTTFLPMAVNAPL